MLAAVCPVQPEVRERPVRFQMRAPQLEPSVDVTTDHREIANHFDLSDLERRRSDGILWIAHGRILFACRTR